MRDQGGIMEKNSQTQKVQRTPIPKETPPIPEFTVLLPVNVRTGPATTFDPIEVLTPGTKVKIFEEKQDWGRIGIDKWINLQSIK